jgi:hypothetical protein
VGFHLEKRIFMTFGSDEGAHSTHLNDNCSCRKIAILPLLHADILYARFERPRHTEYKMPVAQELKVRLLLKEALECTRIAAAMAARDDTYTVATLREISGALEGLRTHLAIGSPAVTRSAK